MSYNSNFIYEQRMKELDQLKTVIERTISLSRARAFNGNLIIQKKKSDELKKLIAEIREHKKKENEWWQQYDNMF